MENCKGNLNDYCYICGHFKVSTQLRSEGVSSVEFQKLFEDYYNNPVIVDKWWAPKSLCKMCYNSLFEWKRSKGKKQMDYGVPMVWSEPEGKKHDPSNCYACVNFVPGANKKKMRNHTYKSVDSALTPLEHDDYGIPYSYPTKDDGDDADATDSSSGESSFDEELQEDPPYEPPTGAVGPQKLTQKDFDFLCKKIRLTADKAKFLAKFFNKHHAMVPGVTTATHFMKKKEGEANPQSQATTSAAASAAAAPAPAASTSTSAAASTSPAAASPPTKRGRKK